jgi:type VI secretion system protein VasD
MEISISADADANIDTHERGAPILLRIYELATSIGFLEADFFALQDRDKITLTSDILSVDTFMLRPGETRSIRRKAQPGTTAIGVFAAYRDLPASVWRASHTLAPAADAHWYRKTPKLRLGVTVQARGLLVMDADAVPEAGQPARARESAKLLPTSVPPAPPLPAAPSAPSMPSLSSIPPMPSVSDIKP